MCLVSKLYGLLQTDMQITIMQVFEKMLSYGLEIPDFGIDRWTELLVQFSYRFLLWFFRNYINISF